MSTRSVMSNDVAALDRHRSPSATEIYSSARSFLRNNSDGQLLQDVEQGLLDQFENQDKANIPNKGEKLQHSPDILQVKAIKQKTKADKLKRSTRRRSSSTESSDAAPVSDLPRPVYMERSRTTEAVNAACRLELERAKTDFGVALEPPVDYSSDNDFMTSIKPNTERASMALAASSSSTRLMSLSLGRGQNIPTSAQAALAEQPPLLGGKIDSTDESVASVDSAEHPSIESYIGQTFPRVKNVDKSAVDGVSSPSSETVVAPTAPPARQDQEHGRKTHRQRKGLKPDTATIIAIASESTKPLQHQEPVHSKSTLVTPPRKVGNIQDGLEHPPTGLSSNSRSGSPMVDADRALSRGGGQSKLREQVTNASSSPAPASTGSDARAVGNDRLLQQRLQEAKALNRRETDSNGGAIMHKFSLWKGVEKRAPLVEPKDGGGISSVQTTAIAPSVEGPVDGDPAIRKHSSDSTSSAEQGIAPPKKTSRRIGGSLATRHVHEEAMEAPTGPVRLAKLNHRKNRSPPLPRSRYGASNESSPAQSSYITPQKTLPHRTGKAGGRCGGRIEFELPSDNDSALEEVSSDDEGNRAMVTASGGRASAFRNMVGICKIHSSSAGSMAESVQTDYGPNSILVATVASNSIDSLYSDDEFENVGDEHETAILGIAIDDCSILSEEDYGDDEMDKASTVEEEIMAPINMTKEKLKGQIMSPESSTSSLAFSQSHDIPMITTSGKVKKDLTVDSLETVEQVTRIATFSPVVEASPDDPPPLRKGEKPAPLFPVDLLPATALSNSCADISSCAPTERRVTSSSRTLKTGKDSAASKPPDKNRCESSGVAARKGRKKRHNRKLSKDVDVLNTSIRSGNRDGLSPTLSEVSDMELDTEEMPPFNSSSLSKTAPPGISAVHNEREEIYAIKDFQWKKGNDIIGEGTFGQVYKGMNCSTGELLAVKQICLTDGTEEEVLTLRKEIDLMQDLVHPNIVRYVGTSVSSRYLFILLEYVPGGCVAGMLLQFGAFSEILIRRLVSQIMQGVDYLHQKGIVHRDIKGGNVLVSDTGVAKLADFGCSKQLAGLCTTSLEESMRTIRGSVPWMAPEVIKQQGHGRSADIWSVGATIIEMATAKHPWPEFSNNLAALFHVATSKHPPPIPDRLSLECATFIKKCMKIDPRERATSKDLLSDPFLLALIITSTGSSTETYRSIAGMETSLHNVVT